MLKLDHFAVLTAVFARALILVRQTGTKHEQIGIRRISIGHNLLIVKSKN